MEDKKIIYIIAGIVGIIFLIGGSIGLLLYFQSQAIQGPTNQDLPGPPLTNTNVNGTLPGPTNTNQDVNGQKTPGQIELEKEKQFISSFYQPITLHYTPDAPQYQLPIPDVKETTLNYRDFSRRIELIDSLNQLSQNGFAVIDEPFSSKPKDWQSAYVAIKDETLPVFVTADAIAGVYQDALDVAYKEIEPEKFYPSLWELLKEMQQQAKKRYESRLQQFGIETDTITEANRLELAFLSVTLKLLQPEQSQVREQIGSDRKYFSPQEYNTYIFQVPEYLRDEVAAEIQLINNKSKLARSPLFLYEQSYAQYEIPQEYQVSEKLKNYYLAITWLQDKNFPLYSQADNCPQCLLDQQDHTINFLASLYLTNDLSSNQEFKNSWANIYKSIGFFRGLEADLTYLDYQLALNEIYGPDYDLDVIFQTDTEKIRESIRDIQDRLASYKFLKALGSRADSPQGADFRFLRDYHLLENVVFNNLNHQSTGQFVFANESHQETLPTTACQAQNEVLRCWPTALDIFSILDNPLAKNLIAAGRNDKYQNYQANKSAIVNDIEQFDQRTWHDNTNLTLYAALQTLDSNNLSAFPKFMQTEAWKTKTLNTALSTWANTHDPVLLEKVSVSNYRGFEPYFPYGYVEPQPEFYAQLLASVRMIKDGFTTLGIINQSDRTYQRFNELESMLARVLTISQDELENKILAPDDYDFINNFGKEIKSITGDIKPENLKNVFKFRYELPERRGLLEYIDGFKYLVVAYPDGDGNPILAIGPILNYTEAEKNNKRKANWQAELNL